MASQLFAKERMLVLPTLIRMQDQTFELWKPFKRYEILQVEGTQLHESAYFDVVSNPIFTGGTSVEIGQIRGAKYPGKKQKCVSP